MMHSRISVQHITPTQLHCLSAPAGPVVINEMLPMPPAGAQASAQWVELFNAGPAAVNLKVGVYVCVEGGGGMCCPPKRGGGIFTTHTALVPLN